MNFSKVITVLCFVLSIHLKFHENNKIGLLEVRIYKSILFINGTPESSKNIWILSQTFPWNQRPIFFQPFLYDFHNRESIFDWNFKRCVAWCYSATSKGDFERSSCSRFKGNKHVFKDSLPGIHNLSETLPNVANCREKQDWLKSGEERKNHKIFVLSAGNLITRWLQAPLWAELTSWEMR